MRLAIIVAMNKDRIIGVNQKIPWHFPEDLKRFRKLTTGHTVIMGRKTFESLPNGPLRGRENIVLTRRKDYTYAGKGRMIVCHSLEEALDEIHNRNVLHVNNRNYEFIDTMPFIIGGASLYAESFPLASHLYVTMMNHNVEVNEGDEVTYFPEFDADEWDEVSLKECGGHHFHVSYRTKWK
jgi:dihydrofolate reductase